MEYQIYDQPKLSAIKALQKLKPKLANCYPDSRIEFACLVYEHDLYQDFVSHNLFDTYGLSDRDLDTCFEMNDSGIVVHGIMKKAINSSNMEACIRTMGSQVWDNWMRIYVDNEPQGSLF